ncbi:putative dehydrogenase [Catenibacillus scindens]|uniref:Putative dehydrogenase n=1 Tax=Catenibacillus scindens TaxID=673271 RepID=A0A7W8HBG1_9FIRM|nr:Gfo/Idh/MocA family oxidoreductase [Catenibacillus scindens]MBB5264627.1 putative dehydrogenase [Catenibacillus scindens]
MKEIRIAVIGTGSISHRHMKVWAHIPQVKVIAAAEIDEKRLRVWSEKYGIADTYTDFREMLKRDDIDAVDVCVHNNLHAPICIAVMKAGLHCYCEKPMSASYYDSKLMMDCAKTCGVKFAVQISSLFSEQTRTGLRLIKDGILGEIYHARSVIANYRRRPSIDGPFNGGTPDFMKTEMAGHGQSIDTGIYHLGQMLFLLGLPKLHGVFGKEYHKIPSPIRGRNIEVEDMCVGLAEFEGGLTLDIQEANACNVIQLPTSYITGDKGALSWWNIDEVGGDWSMGQGPGGYLPENMQPGMRFTGEYHGIHIDCDLRTYYNQMQNRCYDSQVMVWYDNQMHWYKYLIGELKEDERYNTPEIALNVSLLTDGIFLSSREGRFVTTEEIKAQSKSLAMWKQETPWGVFDYEATY